MMMNLKKKTEFEVLMSQITWDSYLGLGVAIWLQRTYFNQIKSRSMFYCCVSCSRETSLVLLENSRFVSVQGRRVRKLRSADCSNVTLTLGVTFVSIRP